MKQEDRGPVPRLPTVGVAEPVPLILRMVHLHAQCSPPIPQSEKARKEKTLSQYRLITISLGAESASHELPVFYCKNPNGMWMEE